MPDSDEPLARRADSTEPTLFGNYQFEVYLKGMTGEAPDFPMSWPDLEAQASAAMDPGTNGYIFGSAGTEDTEHENRAAFKRHRLVPRMLRDVSVRDLRTEIFGVEHAAPVLLAPIGVRGRRGGDQIRRLHGGVVFDGGDRIGRRRRGALVSAVLARGSRAHSQFRHACAGGWLRGTRGDPPRCCTLSACSATRR